MNPENSRAYELTSFNVEAFPRKVDAGAELRLRGEVAFFPPCDLRGYGLLIRDHDGAVQASMAFTDFDGETNRTEEFTLKAPVSAGGYTWSAVCPVPGEEGHMEVSTPVAFTAQAHAANVVVWDAPSAIVAGEKFTIKVGVRCSSRCRMADRALSIRDDKDNKVASGVIRDQIWPGTKALYYTEVELEAPQGEGLFRWTAKVPEWGEDTAHEAGSASFGVTLVKAPDSLVTVEVTDGNASTPIQGTSVVMHPYRAVTDERGVARLRVVNGAYTIFVSGPKYISKRSETQVSGDLTTKVELILEPLREKN